MQARQLHRAVRRNHCHRGSSRTWPFGLAPLPWQPWPSRHTGHGGGQRGQHSCFQWACAAIWACPCALSTALLITNAFPRYWQVLRGPIALLLTASGRQSPAHRCRCPFRTSCSPHPGTHRTVHVNPVLLPPLSRPGTCSSPLCALFPQIYLLVLTLRVILTWFRNINWYNEPFATLRQVGTLTT